MQDGYYDFLTASDTVPERLNSLLERADVIHNSITQITVLTEINLKFKCNLPCEFHIEVNSIVGQVREIKEEIRKLLDDMREYKKGASSHSAKSINEAPTKALANGKRI